MPPATTQPRPLQDIITHFSSSVEFIREGLKSGGVVVHCAAGISRSSSMCIAYVPQFVAAMLMTAGRYLMAERGLSFDDAYQTVKLCRPCIDPNPGAWLRWTLPDVMVLVVRCGSGCLRRLPAATQAMGCDEVQH